MATAASLFIQLLHPDVSSLSFLYVRILVFGKIYTVNYFLRFYFAFL